MVVDDDHYLVSDTVWQLSLVRPRSEDWGRGKGVTLDLGGLRHDQGQLSKQKIQRKQDNHSGAQRMAWKF